MADKNKTPVLSVKDVQAAASLLLSGDDAVLGIDQGIEQLRDMLVQIAQKRAASKVGA